MPYHQASKTADQSYAREIHSSRQRTNFDDQGVVARIHGSGIRVRESKEQSESMGGPICVLLLILVLTARFAESNPNYGSITRVQSVRGSALVLPLTGFESSPDRHHRGRALGQDARMTLHDDLLTKGCVILNPNPISRSS